MLLPICFIVDINVFMYLEMVCKSIMKTLSIPYHFCILTESTDTAAKVLSLLTSFCDATCITVKSLSEKDTEYLNSLYIQESRSDITGFGYAQLLICNYFDNHKKILFMEPDQIVQHDLAPFWKEMHEKSILLAAVNYNNGGYTLATLNKLYKEGIVIKICAFNCGVVVYDTEFWIKNNLGNLCFDAAVKQKETNGTYYNYYAEGAMNVALQNYFYELEPKYNFCDLGWKPHISKSDLNSAIILHWNGIGKPWKDDGYYKEHYTLQV
jgi:lipopolysaccharide biosynthesis glycosyltransferase